MVEKELKIKFNTENGQADFRTPFIEGELNSLIITSKTNVSITIMSSLGYLIFHTSEHKGTEYYAPRTVMQGPKSRLIVKDQFTKFKLNEELDILVSGPTNTDVSLILRVD